jgi:crotonobetainyl-CoA:carnitine CoA-transferase CaiB-like acyl-CoA transferase
VSAGPLAGVKVLDFTHFLAGPYAGLILADLGADVIKVEDVDHLDEARGMGPHFFGGESLYFLSLNWGKRSVAVRLSRPRGREVIMNLARAADVVLDNYRPGVMAKFGLDHESLAGVNPGLITCSLTGFGETGPYASQPGYDYTIQALSGVMSMTGEPDTAPGKAGISYVDHSGAVAAALAVCAALFERNYSGKGRHVDVGLLDVQISMLTYLASWQLNAGVEPGRTPRASHPTIVPAQNFATRNGYISLFVGNDAMWRKLVDAVGDSRLEDDRYATNEGRNAERAELLALLDEVFLTESSEEWIRRLTARRVPCARINNVSQALSDHHVLSRNLVAVAASPRYGRYRHVAGPVPTMGVAGDFGAPVLGEHTSDVLRDFGYDASSIAELAADGTIVLPEGDS